MTHLLTLYARREPATMRPHVHVNPHGVPANERDVVLYREPQCQNQCGVYPWHLPNRPRRSSRKVMHNCYRYGLEWLDDLRCDASARAPLFPPHLPSKVVVDEDGQQWRFVLLV